MKEARRSKPLLVVPVQKTAACSGPRLWYQHDHEEHKSKTGRPKTTGPGLQLQVRVHPPLLGQIDKWIARQKQPISRAEAIRRLVDEKLSRRR